MKKRETTAEANFRFRARLCARVDVAFEVILDKLIENAKAGQYNSAQLLLRSIGVLDGNEQAGRATDGTNERKSIFEYLRADLEGNTQSTLADARLNA